MEKEFEALEPSVVLKFVDDLLKRYENETDYNIYITKDWLLEIKQALTELKQIKEAKPSEAMECLNKIVESFNETSTGMYGLGEVVVANDLIYGFKEELETIKQALQRKSKGITKEAIINIIDDELEKRKENTFLLWDFPNAIKKRIDELDTTEQALLKAQKPKNYIKWEDLEKFKDKDSVKVKMNDTELSLIIQIDCLNDIYVQLYKEKEDGYCVNLLHDFFRDKELFNNLRLELLE